ncbi:hypothetical protein D16iCDA_17450 [Pseudomonas seleniipraecipitans]|jgi:hypothetical protein|uniref:Uncharacterized protein n=1 Tax=Phytopseudomonas seleniipraecipitans TaxID=640205 RepID=A0A1G7GSR9_9GAMM|nr:hypothetical protein [Pseudomonas seleniipraecipitans]NQD79226.1 hypothetical protein [Pseudomonas sp. CrR14]UUD63450.1 hypothetical protein D16iCDA_17450 [Pseudomonas seleniipraecipitans]SDE91174.1 hypothetical protein SAMN05216381_0319 [Pseudomonas seleniipraecipitans]
MATHSEMVLEQAMLAVLGACIDLGYDVDKLAKHAQMLILDNSKYNHVEQPQASTPHEALERALSTVKSAPRL